MDRNSEFANGAISSTAFFYSVQQERPQGYRPLSVLDSPIRSPLGLGLSETQRLMPDGRLLPSKNGFSDETYERRAWLGRI